MEKFDKKYWLFASKLIVYFQAVISKTVNAKKEKKVVLFSFEILPIDVTFKASESKIQNLGGKNLKSQQFFENYLNRCPRLEGFAFGNFGNSSGNSNCAYPFFSSIENWTWPLKISKIMTPFSNMYIST